MDRRAFLASVGALSLGLGTRPRPGKAASSKMLTRTIPASGEALPAVGMGTWITFNVGDDLALRNDRVEVLRTFFDRGGALIDSSPMYGSSEEVVGYALARLDDKAALFSATKVWTMTRWLGIRQMEASEALWGEERFDLMQIHNLVDWKTHLETLLEWKEAGRIRYIGVTTSHGRRHAELERIMASQPIDFVQFTYNILDREAESRLLPLAAEKGLAVLANRPFRRGALFDLFERQALPEWAGEIDCANWAQFFLKFILSHPAVTCAIPATSRVDHMKQNMGAGLGALPDPDLRRRMVAYLENLG